VVGGALPSPGPLCALSPRPAQPERYTTALLPVGTALEPPLECEAVSALVGQLVAALRQHAAPAPAGSDSVRQAWGGPGLAGVERERGLGGGQR